MLKQFESNIIKNRLFTKSERLLLALSGGADSVVLASLLKKAKYNFSVAHCNFQLRGKESDADESFCRQFAEQLEAGFYCKRFDTAKYARQQKVSIQMAARTLRYAWFYEVLESEGFDYIVTAHHANDVVETVLINLLRGTGINGLLGVPMQNAVTIRPLLPFSKDEILTFAKQNKIKYREDKSNADDKYERNFIRLKVVPLLQKINPSLEHTFIKNVQFLRQDAMIVKDYLSHKTDKLVSYNDEKVVVDKKKLVREPHLERLLHFITAGYGFNETQQMNILRNVSSGAESGKKFVSKTHRLSIERDVLLIAPRTKEKFPEAVISSFKDFEKLGFVAAELSKFEMPLKSELIIHPWKLIFPLIIRQRRNGDKFKPFGMKGFKLVSDFIKDEKLNSIERDNLKLLVNGNGEIIWLIGYRSDERYRVSQHENKFLKLHSL